MAASPTTTELLKLAEFLDLRAVEADAKADVHRKAKEIPDAEKEVRRAKSGRHFAQVCRDAAAKLTTKEKRGHFVPPSLAEVAAEMKRYGLPEREAEFFLGHYESNGWKVGQNRMVSWEKAVVTWKERYFEKNPAKRPAAPAAKQPTLSGILGGEDPEGWAPFLKREGLSHVGHRWAAQWIRDKFNQSKK